MASALVIPGVQVRTLFEPSPVLPGATGILGVVGVADRGPTEPTRVGNFSEFSELFGPASRFTLPEVRTAFANGVSQVVVARIEPGRGTKASLRLKDDEGEEVALLEARAEGLWARQLAVRASQVKALSGQGVKYVNLEVFYQGRLIESHDGLVMDETSPDSFFDRINRGSRVLVARDPLFDKALPRTAAKATLGESEAQAAKARLKAGAVDVIAVEAKRAGRQGNQIALRVSEGQASLALPGAADAPSLVVRAKQAGPDGTNLRVAVVDAGDSKVNLVVANVGVQPPQPGRVLGPFAKVEEIPAKLAGDPEVVVEVRGAVLPAVRAAAPLASTRTLEVIAEGRDTGIYANLADLDAIAAVNDPVVKLEKVGAATQLPTAAEAALEGGRSRGAALPLFGDADDQHPLAELVPVAGTSDRIAATVTQAVSTLDGTTAVVNLALFRNDEPAESFANLTMDPDDPSYLPFVLGDSALVRAFDLFARSRTTSFPAHMSRPAFLTGGSSPLPEDYQAALERLEAAEEVDLVIASAAHQLGDADVRSVHKAVVAHCTKMAEVARNRIGLGSVTAAESGSVAQILDHANDVRSDAFILTAPAGSEAAVAGLLGRQDFFESPTFKTVADLGVPAGTYSDAQLNQLVAGNVLVVNQRRKLGTLVIKGLLTSGRQVNVQRTANKAVREVKAISDVYIGLLNNEGTRNALRQQIFAMLLQMERDGALVPSTDGKDPAFGVDVHSTQADFANGIVRIDIKVRPVRAIDYIYATILVKN
ncbi:MAG: hypothetical protein U0002_18600 [Thermoanaerobaculia bacterium]